MLPYLILGVALLAGFMLAGRWYATADPRTLVKVLKWSLIGLVSTIVIFFVTTGRLGWAFATLPALAPWFMRARSMARMAKTFSRMAQSAHSAANATTTGETSDVESRYLRMTLDHDSGRMGGEVIAGVFAGRRIEAMRLDELIQLLSECWRGDDESARLLEAYLDREHADWREHAKEKSSSQTKPGAMDRAEALQILGLADDAGEADIKEAYRRLIAGMHPDHGGSDYLAAQINRAKDVLLGE